MTPSTVWTAAAAMAFLAFSGRAAAEGIPSGIIRGRIPGFDGRIPIDTRLRLACDGDPPVTWEGRPAADGTFRFENLPPGRCRIEVSAGAYDSPGPSVLVLGPQEEHVISLPLIPKSPSRTGPPTRAGAFDGVPLPARTLGGVLQGLGALSPLAYDPDRRLHGVDRFRLDGFDLTDPFDGSLTVDLPLEAIWGAEVTQLGLGDGTTGQSGIIANARTFSGSNLLEATAIGTYGPASLWSTSAAAGGPMVKDRMWWSGGFELGGRAGAETSRGLSDRRGLAKVVWQVSARNKLTLLWAGSRMGHSEVALPAKGQTPLPRRWGGLWGLGWESLANDQLVARVQAGLSAWGQRPTGTGSRSLERLEGVGSLQWFLDSRALGEHVLSLVLSGDHLLGAPSEAALDGRSSIWRSVFADTWRVRRHLRIAPAVGVVSNGSWAASEAELGLVWDLTADGRTAFRTAIARARDVNHLTEADPAQPAGPGPPQPRWEASLGVNRQIMGRTVLSARYIERRYGPTGGGQPPTRQRTGVLAVDKTAGRLTFRAQLSWQGETADPISGLIRSAAWILPGLGFSGSVAYDDALSWAHAFTEGGSLESRLEPRASGRAKTLIVNLRVAMDLRPRFGLPALLFLDGLDLVSAHPGSTPGLAESDPRRLEAHLPGRTLRLSLRMSL